MSLDNKQIKAMRTIGHRLNPIVTVSNGLNDNIHKEIDRALEDHELIKVKINTAERSERQALVRLICDRHRAQTVQEIGSIALLYRAAAKPKPKLSNLLRYRNQE